MENRCDDESGLCAAPALVGASRPAAGGEAGWELAYVGDPMCSWCWGVAPLVARLPAWCEERGAVFSIVAGGLRPGGGDPWNTGFKAFLRQHWTEIGELTGQRFELGLLAREHFHYDTEPACRAVVVARPLLAPRQDNGCSLARFFAALQEGFYVRNEDPGQLDFYRAPCAAVGIDFEAFAAQFASPAARQATVADFQRNRDWGVRGFPSFVLLRGAQAEVIASGYVDLPGLEARVAHSRLGGAGGRAL